MRNKKSKITTDEEAGYDVMPCGGKNPRRFFGFDRPPGAENDLFWWMKIFDTPGRKYFRDDEESDPTKLN